MQAVRQGLKSFLNLNRWFGGKAENPFQMPLPFDTSKEDAAQDQQVNHPGDTKRGAERESP